MILWDFFPSFLFLFLILIYSNFLFENRNFLPLNSILLDFFKLSHYRETEGQKRNMLFWELKILISEIRFGFFEECRILQFLNSWKTKQKSSVGAFELTHVASLSESSLELMMKFLQQLIWFFLVVVFFCSSSPFLKQSLQVMPTMR